MIAKADREFLMKTRVTFLEGPTAFTPLRLQEVPTP